MDEWILTRLEEIKKRFAEIENLMTKQEVVSNQNEMKKLSKEYRNLEKINKLFERWLVARFSIPIIGLVNYGEYQLVGYSEKLVEDLNSKCFQKEKSFENCQYRRFEQVLK